MTINEAFLLTGFLSMVPATILSVLTYFEGEDTPQSLLIATWSAVTICLGSFLAAIWIGVTV